MHYHKEALLASITVPVPTPDTIYVTRKTSSRGWPCPSRFLTETAWAMGNPEKKSTS
jgi:hypothetical protein